MSADVKLVEDIKGTSRDILEANLSDDEPVFVFMEGVWGQSIVATDRRVLIIKTGLQAGGAGFGKKCKTFPYEHVTSIDCNKGIAMGRLQVTAGGTTENRTGFFSGARSAENVVSFRATQYHKFQVATNRVRKLLEDRRTKLAKPVITQQTESIPDQIKKLSELKEAGILTAEEFETKKKELLKRL
jgi:hypothetical protein